MSIDCVSANRDSGRPRVDFRHVATIAIEDVKQPQVLGGSCAGHARVGEPHPADWRVRVELEHAFREAAGRRQHMPRIRTARQLDPIRRPLDVRESEVRDETLRDAFALEPIECGVLPDAFLAFDKFEPADLQGRSSRRGNLATRR